MRKGTIFLDYDGTLHDCMKVYGPAFRKAVAWLEEQGLLEHVEYDDSWISHWLGWTVKDMWNTFAPQLPEKVWQRASKMIGEEMDRLAREGKGGLFEEIPAALEELRVAGYRLVFLSNCKTAYKEAHRGYYGLDRWIDAYFCAGDYPGLKKHEIYLEACKNPDLPKPHLMVGDRFHDLEVGALNGLPTIGCLYGYGLDGELDAATIKIQRPSELPDAVKELLP